VTKAILPAVPLRLINAVNHELDKPSAWAGPTHRKYLHDPVSASLVGMTVAQRMGYSGSLGIAAALAHLAEDGMSDQMRKVRVTKKLTVKNLFDELTK